MVMSRLSHGYETVMSRYVDISACHGYVIHSFYCMHVTWLCNVHIHLYWRVLYNGFILHSKSFG